MLRLSFILAVCIVLGGQYGFATGGYGEVSEFLYEYGMQRLRDGNLADAEHEFKKALIANPNNRLAQLALKELGKPKEKFKPYDKSLALREVPLASAGGNCREFIFDGRKSYDPNGLPLSWEWDFGDGTSASGQLVRHTYEKGGEYLIRLTVKNNANLTCSIASVNQSLRVNSAPEPVFTCPNAACTTQEIIFDASQTIDDTPDTLRYTWDFGDGTSAEGKQVAKRFASPGSYPVILKVDDNSASPCSVATVGRTVTVYSPLRINGPKEDVLLVFRQGQGYKVDFVFVEVSSDDCRPLTYEWDLGDGTKEISMRPSHVYARGGRYKVTLVADDGLGLECSRASHTFYIVLNKPPVAELGVDLLQVCFDCPVAFDGSASRAEEGETLTYHWDFGDGTTSEELAPLHTYPERGEYTVTLTVNDGWAGSLSSSSDKCKVKVLDKPVAVMEVIQG